GELFYACNENRLIEAKGFGFKTQEEIKKAIEFAIANQGWFLYANVEKIAEEVRSYLQHLLPNDRKISYTGDFRRKCEVLQSVDQLVEASLEELTSAVLTLAGLTVQSPANAQPLEARTDAGVLFRFIPTDPTSFYRQLIISTGSDEHLR